MKWIASFLFLGLTAAGTYWAVQDAGPLRERLGDKAPGTRWIYDDWPQAMDMAKKTGRPIFAVFRCVP